MIDLTDPTTYMLYLQWHGVEIATAINLTMDDFLEHIA